MLFTAVAVQRNAACKLCGVALVQTQHVYDKKIAEELKDCDNIELQAFLEIIQSTKKVLRKNRATTI